MAPPAFDLTWQYNKLNQQIAASGAVLTTNRTVLLALINSLIGFSSGAAQVRGSSDGSTASLALQADAGPGTNRWTDISKLVWAAAGSAHSWIVLRQTGIGARAEICISCEGASVQGYLLTVATSMVGFTGGSTTARPTATDEYVILNGAAWGPASSDGTYRLHVWGDTAGKCMRWAIYSAGSPSVLGFWELPKNPVSGWTSPYVCHWGGSNYTSLAGGANTFGRGASNMAMYLTSEAVNGTHIHNSTQAINDLSQEWPMPAIGLFSTTAGNFGRHGELYDMRWAMTSFAEGTGAPLSSPTWAVVGDLWLPCNTTLQVS